MAEARKPIAHARSLYFALYDARLTQYETRQVQWSLSSLKKDDRKAWEVLRDAHVYGREVDWVAEEEAFWKLAGFLAAAGVRNCQATSTQHSKETVNAVA